MPHNNIKPRKKDSARLVWDNKPSRAPNPKDIEFQTTEIIVPNPKNAGDLTISFHNRILGEPELDKQNTDNSFHKLDDISNQLFGHGYKLLPSVTELFELELANLEYQVLSTEDLIDRSAFFETACGTPTAHFKLCSKPQRALMQDRSAQTRNYFKNGQFSTGYATHGLFPYRGKFHPQLIKGLLNIIGIKKADIVLDPMCGSGTTNIEAALMGIDSYAVDHSPFCRFMTKTKFEAMTIPPKLLSGLSRKAPELFAFFNVNDFAKQFNKIKDFDKLKVYSLALLAFLDALGYSKRVTASTHNDLFEKVLRRYEMTVSEFIENPEFHPVSLGKVIILENSDALKLELPNESVDGIITSPPYSFAIDYVKNDDPQLRYLGCDPDTLRTNMIGLVGKNKKERLNNYFHAMGIVCSECARVLKTGKFLVIILGSNTNQTGGIRLENQVIESCVKVGLNLVKSILKPIKGLRNIMKDEYILFFRKNAK
jgi:hypothetical protein